MIFAFSPDNGYAMPTGVLMCSICENTPGPHEFYFLSGEDLAEDYKRNLQSVAEKYSAKTFFLPAIKINGEWMPTKVDGQPQYISPAAYQRLFMSSTLPNTVDKVLYLDGDIICRHSLAELWNTEIDDCPLAAVYEIENNDGRYVRLGYRSEEGYYNSGVMLVNLKYWREHGIQEAFESFARLHNDKIVYHDQDVINAVLHGQIKTLPLKYNALNNYYVDDHFGYLYDRNGIEKAIKDPVLVHYSCSLKPWYKGCGHPFVKDFLHYKEISPFASQPLSVIKASSMKGFLSNILVCLGIRSYNGRYKNIRA